MGTVTAQPFLPRASTQAAWGSASTGGRFCGVSACSAWRWSSGKLCGFNTLGRPTPPDRLYAAVPPGRAGSWPPLWRPPGARIGRNGHEVHIAEHPALKTETIAVLRQLAADRFCRACSGLNVSDRRSVPFASMASMRAGEPGKSRPPATAGDEAYRDSATAVR